MIMMIMKITLIIKIATADGITTSRIANTGTTGIVFMYICIHFRVF